LDETLGRHRDKISTCINRNFIFRFK